MAVQRFIFLVVFDGFELLDMSGPASVFNMANKICGGGAYRIQLMSARGGMVGCNSGIVVDTANLGDLRAGPRDTLLVVGGDEKALTAAQADADLIGALQHVAATMGRYGSVCTGAFIAATAGFMDGRGVTTHWRESARLQAMFPSLSVQPDRLYIRDGNVWSSAGISSGIDLALAMVEQDHGPAIRSRVAKRLVVYAHRPGTQAQFSSVLETQAAVNDAFHGVLSWILERLDDQITVRGMAEAAGMSERSFYRKFTHSVGMTPSKFLEQARLDKARQLLEAGARVKAVPSQVGFLSETGFRAAFEKKFKMSPTQFKLLHGGG